MSHVIVIGGSHAASQLVVSLRQGGFEGDITLIGDEADLPYHRPPLSKDFLSGDKPLGDILLRPAETYHAANVKMMLGKRVTQLDAAAKTIMTDSGEALTYDKLVLCTGARVRKLPIPGADAAGVYYLRDTDDVRAIKAGVAAGKKCVIIGGGYIGLETAASLKKQGMDVTVLEAMDRVLQRVTAPVMSDFYRRVHTEEGVKIFESELATKIDGRGEHLAVHTSEGGEYKADMVIIGIGVIPNTQLAEMAGLEVGDGIVVDEFARTSHPDIYAAGDVTWHYNPIYDTHLRLESVPNATEQAKTVANHINGKAVPYKSLPWFWSDQFDLKLQIAGLSAGYDDIVLRGDPEAGRSFAAFYFENDRLLAVDAVNDPRSFVAARMALSKGLTLDKVMIADPAANLKDAMI